MKIAYFIDKIIQYIIQKLKLKKNLIKSRNFKLIINIYVLTSFYKS
jgi:hypothetical protein